MDIKIVILEIISIVLDIYFTFTFCNRMAKMKRINKGLNYIYYIVTFLIITIITFLRVSIFYQAIAIISIVYIYMHFFRKGSKMLNLFSAILVNNVIASITIWTFVLVDSLKIITLNNFITGETEAMVLFLLDTVIKVLILARVYSVKRDFLNIPNKILAILTMLCCTSLFMELLNFGIYKHASENLSIAFVYTILDLVINVITLSMYFVYLNEYSEKIDIKNKLEVTNAVNSYNEETKEAFKEMSKIRHDYNNHIQVIYALYKMNKLDQANNYINVVSSKIDKITERVYTTNETLDAILFNKVSLCKINGIDIKIKACKIENMFISDYDICTLFGNLLDNAIEASLHLEQMDREILLSIDIVKSCLVIKLCNNTNHNQKYEKNRLISIKKEKGHGIGIPQIEAVVEKYSGEIFNTIENNKFVTDIVLLNQ